MAKASRKPALTERKIVDAALALVDAGGRDAASIRRIAAALGAAPNAVYTYFPDQVAVERAVVNRVLGTVTSAGGTEGMALDLRRVLIAHPRVVPIALSAHIAGPMTLGLAEGVGECLAGDGFAGAATTRGAYALVGYVFGSVALAVGGVPVGLEEFRWGLERLLEGIRGGGKLD